MRKICSWCFEHFEAEFDPANEYGGDFCCKKHKIAWLKQRGMIKPGQEGLVK